MAAEQHSPKKKPPAHKPAHKPAEETTPTETAQDEPAAKHGDQSAAPARPRPQRRHGPEKPGEGGTTVVGETQVHVGGLSAADAVKRAFQSVHIRKRCLAGWSQGQMRVLFRMDAAGAFEAAEILLDDLQGPEVSSCMRQALREVERTPVAYHLANRRFVQLISPPHGNPIVEQREARGPHQMPPIPRDPTPQPK